MKKNKGENNMKKIIVSITTIALVIFVSIGLFACAGAGYDGYSNGSSAAGQDKLDGGYIGSTNTTPITADRKIIKNVYQYIDTDSFDDFVTAMKDKITELEGSVDSARISSNGGLRTASYTVRIPAGNLYTFTERVDDIAVITRYDESLVDVTASYIYTDSRLMVLESSEKSLLKMLESAESVAEILVIDERLTEVQADLASLRAQKESYDNRIAYSTVWVTVSEVREARENEVGFFDEVGAVFKDSLHDIGNGLRSFGVWLLGDSLYILMTLLAIAVLATPAIIFVRHRKRKLPRPATDKSDTEKSDNQNE